jgi:hypothetical protein
VTGTAVATGWYVYGVVDADRDDDLGSGVELLRGRRLAAVAAPVDLDEFGEAGLARNLEDRAWLEERVRRHEAVLERVVAHGPVVPFRFGAIYSRAEDVRAMLEERHEELAAALARVRGRVELGVKGWLDRERLESRLARERPPASPASAGRAYLERRRAERDDAGEAGARALHAARAAHERLLELATAGVVNRPQPRELSRRSEQMVLNAAYLVPAGDTRLREVVDALNRESERLALTFEVTGPWPPYNFVAAEESS